jgi:hypothetical protein
MILIRGRLSFALRANWQPLLNSRNAGRPGVLGGASWPSEQKKRLLDQLCGGAAMITRCTLGKIVTERGARRGHRRATSRSLRISYASRQVTVLGRPRGRTHCSASQEPCRTSDRLNRRQDRRLRTIMPTYGQNGAQTAILGAGPLETRPTVGATRGCHHTAARPTLQRATPIAISAPKCPDFGAFGAEVVIMRYIHPGHRFSVTGA